MLQMLLHQRHGAFFVARGQGRHDGGMFFVRVRGGAAGLVHERDERAARDQVASICASTSLPMSSAMRMEVAQQLGAAADVGTVHGGLLAGHMGAHRSDLMGRCVALRTKARVISVSSMRRTAKTWRLCDRGRGDKRAACGRQRDQAVLRQLEQTLAHQRARDAKSGRPASARPAVPGSRRCSTMARVSVSTMVLVEEGSMAA